MNTAQRKLTTHRNEAPPPSGSLSASGGEGWGEVASCSDGSPARQCGYTHLQLSTEHSSSSASAVARQSEARRGFRSAAKRIWSVKVRPSEPKRGQERLTKKLEQTCLFRLSIFPKMRKP